MAADGMYQQFNELQGYQFLKLISLPEWTAAVVAAGTSGGKLFICVSAGRRPAIIGLLAGPFVTP